VMADLLRRRVLTMLCRLFLSLFTPESGLDIVLVENFFLGWPLSFFVCFFFSFLGFEYPTQSMD